MRIIREYTQHLDATAAEVFPLICPVREADWLPGFEYRMVHSQSGVAETGCVFTTSKADEPDTVWCITRHDESWGRVEFVRVTPGLVLTQIRVDLADVASGGCTAELTYTFTSLSSQGDAYIRSHHDEAGFEQMAKRWETCLNRYVRASRGRTAEH